MHNLTLVTVPEIHRKNKPISLLSKFQSVYLLTKAFQTDHFDLASRDKHSIQYCFLSWVTA